MSDNTLSVAAGRGGQPGAAPRHRPVDGADADPDRSAERVCDVIAAAQASGYEGLDDDEAHAQGKPGDQSRDRVESPARMLGLMDPCVCVMAAPGSSTWLSAISVSVVTWYDDAANCSPFS